ncbi:MAG: ABC transporter ATP-binding protein [Bacteroidota bacterium]
MTLLKASGITKSYGNLPVLKGVNMEIHNKEVVSIVGASGAGKSTLLHILGLLDSPDGGSVSLNNTDLEVFTASEKAKFRNQQIGFVFQFHNLLPEFTALENVCMPGYIKGDGKTEVESRGADLLNHLGLEGRGQHKPSQLSGGEQQRVAVARALINKPSIVFADEPSGNLDSKNAQGLHDIFFELRDRTGQTFVIVTHNTELADMADRKLVMEDGQLLA